MQCGQQHLTERGSQKFPRDLRKFDARGVAIRASYRSAQQPCGLLPIRHQASRPQVICLSNLHMKSRQRFRHEPKPLQFGFIVYDCTHASAIELRDQQFRRRQLIECRDRNSFHDETYAPQQVWQGTQPPPPYSIISPPHSPESATVCPERIRPRTSSTRRHR